MNSKYNQAEMSRLRQILYPQRKSQHPQLDDLDETNESKMPESNKENYCSGANIRSHSSTSCIKAQMSRLKGEVEEMLRSDEQLDSVLNSTTRFYLERIRQMSSELPEEIACLEEASNGLISSLPPPRQQLKLAGSEHISTKVFVREAEKWLVRIRQRQMSDAFTAIAQTRRQHNDMRRVHEIRKLLMLSHGFRRWRHNIVEEELNQKYIVNQQGIESLTGLLDHFLNEGQLIVQLTNLVREEADFAEVLIYQKETSRLYTYLESYSGITNNSQVESVSTFERIRTSESEQSEIKRYEIQLEDSLTRLCICRKEVLRLDRIEQDRDYASCDAMINQQIESFRPLSLGAVFMPLLSPSKEVVGMLRLYFIDKLNAEIDVRIAEFLGGIVEAARELFSKLKHIHIYKRQEKTQLYCRMLPLLKMVDTVSTSSELFEKLFEGLRVIFFLDGVTLVKHENNSLKKVFSTATGDIKDKKHLLHCLKVMQERNEPLVQIDNTKVLRIGSSIHIQGLLELVQPRVDIPATALDLLMRYVMKKVGELEHHQKQFKEQLRLMEMRELAQKRSKNKQITRDFGLKLLECETYEQLCRKFEEYIGQLDYQIVSAQMFLKLHGHYLSYNPNKQERVKSRNDSHPLIRKLTKNIRLVVPQSDENYEDVLDFSWKKEANQTTGLAVINLPIEINELAGYLLSVSVPLTSLELEHLTEDLQCFIGCIKGVSKQTVQTATKEDLGELATNEYYSTSKSCPIQAAESILKAATGRQCRIMEYLCDRLLFRDQPIDLPQDFFQQTFKNGIVELPKSAGLPLTVQDPELSSELERIELSQLRHCRQELVTLSRLFGHKIDRLVSASVTVQGKMFLVLLEGPVNHQFVDLYEQMRDTLHSCISRNKSFHRQKMYLNERARSQRFAECLHQIFMVQLQRTFNSLASQQRQPAKLVSFGIVQMLFKRQLRIALHRIAMHSIERNEERNSKHSFVNINQLCRTFKLLEHSNYSAFFRSLQRRDMQLTKLSRGARFLNRKLAIKQSHLLVHAFDKLKDFRRNYEYPTVFQSLISNRLLSSFTSIKHANRVTCDNRESFLSCFVFEPELSSVKKVFERVSEIEQFTFYLENRNTGRRVSWNRQSGLKLTQTRNQQLPEVRFESKHWTVLWTYPSKDLLDLEFKQYLSIVAKAVTDNLNNIRKQSSPLVKLMNTIGKATLRSLKTTAMRRWRSELLKESKKLEYSLIEKAYRMNQQLLSLTEIRQKKRGEQRRKQQELQSAKNHIDQTTQLIQYQQQEITKMEKMISCNDLLYRLREVLGQRVKLRNFWLRWRGQLHTDSVTPSSQSRINKQIKSMANASLSILQRLFKRTNRHLKLEAFKQLTINSVKSRQFQESRSFSPIKRPDYMSLVEECQVDDHNNMSHLVVEQFDDNSKLSTFSKIEPILVPRNSPTPLSSIHPTASKNTKYISENVPPARRSPVPPTPTDLTTPARLSTSCMNNVRQRMIMHNSQQHDSGQKSTPLGYKLSNQTMRFLKKFGRDVTPSRANQSDFN